MQSLILFFQKLVLHSFLVVDVMSPALVVKQAQEKTI